MGYDLYNEQGQDFRWNIGNWGPLLKLANQYGWEPEGTQHPEYADWDGMYFSNDGQRVSATDAAALADALERALPDISDEPALLNLLTIERPAHDGIGDFTIAVSPREGAEVSLMDTFSGDESKAYIQQFIVFCRAGAFHIT